mmetsp:Transcript_112740/g.360141  ORF Transcript_112740/g.360141 Transcript_112740/m.360141 type:complete len:589 (+) Transcript_112740:218-1984(+)
MPRVPAALPRSQPWFQCRGPGGLPHRCREGGDVGRAAQAALGQGHLRATPGRPHGAHAALPTLRRSGAAPSHRRLREADLRRRRLHLVVVPLVQEKQLKWCQRTAPFHVEGPEEAPRVASEAKNLAALAELSAGDLSRAISVENAECCSYSTKLLLGPVLEAHERGVRDGVELVQRDASREVLVECPPGTRDVATEADPLAGSHELLPVALVAVVFVKDLPPRLQEAPKPLQQQGLELLRGLRVGMSEKEGEGPPPLDEGHVLLRQAVHAVLVESVEDELGPRGPVEAERLHSLDELVEADGLGAVLVDGAEGGLHTPEALQDEDAEASEHLGAVGVELVQGHLAALVAVQRVPEQPRVVLPADLDARPEELGPLQHRGVVGAQQAAPGPEEAPVPPPQELLELLQARARRLQVLGAPVALQRRLPLRPDLHQQALLLRVEPPEAPGAEGALAPDVQRGKEELLAAAGPAVPRNGRRELRGREARVRVLAAKAPRHLAAALVRGRGPVAELPPVRGLRTVDLLRREVARAVGVQRLEERHRLLRGEGAPTREGPRALEELGQRDPRAAPPAEVSQPGGQGRALPLLQE